MRIILLISTLLIITAQQIIAQPVTFDWSRGIGGKNNPNGRVAIAKDDNGDVYVMGQFTGTRNFGSIQLTALGTTDVFVAKMSGSFGPVLWAVRAGSGFSIANAGGITVSGTNVYVTGSFSNFISFGNNCTINNPGGNKNAFIASLSTTNGACNWIVKGGGQYDALGVAITPATGGGVYISGTFTGSADFGTYSLATSSILDSDIFYAKYSATGTCEWAKKFGGFGTEAAGGIKEVSPTVIVMNGGFEDFIPAPGGNITSAGAMDFFLTKFNNQGNLIWASSGGGLEGEVGLSVDVDTAGNIYSTGSIGNDVVFGSIFLPNPQFGNMFITKHNSNGVCQWIHMGGTISDDLGQAIATDPNGSSYVTGYVSDNAYFGTTPLTGVIGNESYVVKYNTFGTIVWITKIGSAGTENGKAILYAGNGSVVTAGEFDGTLSLTANPISSPGAGLFGVYVTRLGGGSVGLNEVSEQVISLYPNPTTDYINLDLTKIKDAAFTVELFSTDGKLILTKLLTAADAVAAYQIDVKDFASGNYILKVSSSIGENSQPVVISRN